MRKLLTIIALFVCLSAFAQSGSHFTINLGTLGAAGVNPASNRVIFVQPMSVPTVSSPSVIVGGQLVTNTDTNGVFILSNAVVPMLYRVQILSPPQSSSFMFYAPTNGLGSVSVNPYLVASSTATFPAGTVAWAAAASDLRYLLNGDTNNSFAITNDARVLTPSNRLSIYKGSFVGLNSDGTTNFYSRPGGGGSTNGFYIPRDGQMFLQEGSVFFALPQSYFYLEGTNSQILYDDGNSVGIQTGSKYWNFMVAAPNTNTVARIGDVQGLSNNVPAVVAVSTSFGTSNSIVRVRDRNGTNDASIIINNTNSIPSGGKHITVTVGQSAITSTDGAFARVRRGDQFEISPNEQLVVVLAIDNNNCIAYEVYQNTLGHPTQTITASTNWVLRPAQMRWTDDQIGLEAYGGLMDENGMFWFAGLGDAGATYYLDYDTGSVFSVGMAGQNNVGLNEPGGSLFTINNMRTNDTLTGANGPSSQLYVHSHAPTETMGLLPNGVIALGSSLQGDGTHVEGITNRHGNQITIWKPLQAAFGISNAVGYIGQSANFTVGAVTNNGLVWHSTNATPTFAYPNGSIATITDGRAFIMTNGAWVQLSTGSSGGTFSGDSTQFLTDTTTHAKTGITLTNAVFASSNSQPAITATNAAIGTNAVGSAMLSIQNNSSNKIGVYVNQSFNQASNLMEFRDTNSAVLSSISPSGGLQIGPPTGVVQSQGNGRIEGNLVVVSNIQIIASGGYIMLTNGIIPNVNVTIIKDGNITNTGGIFSTNAGIGTNAVGSSMLSIASAGSNKPIFSATAAFQQNTANGSNFVQYLDTNNTTPLFAVSGQGNVTAGASSSPSATALGTSATNGISFDGGKSVDLILNGTNYVQLTNGCVIIRNSTGGALLVVSNNMIGIGILPTQPLQVRTGTDQNFLVQAKQLLADGVAFSSVNDANSLNKGFETRGAINQMTSIGATPVQFAVNATLVGEFESGGGGLRVRSLTSTNGITLRATNTIPPNVTVGTTAPDTWYTVTNAAGQELDIPAWHRLH